MNERETNPTAAPVANVGQTRRTQGLVLALNAGSSSLKFALFDGGPRALTSERRV